MDILFVTPEIAPYGGTGAVADVAAALPKALRGLDHKVTVLSPLWRGIDPLARSLARRLSKVEVELGGQLHAAEVYDGRTAGGVDLVFVGHEELFHSADRMQSEGEDPALVARRAGLFGRAAAEVARARGVDVVHGHDWPGALAVAHLAAPTPIPSVLTVHDPSSQGRFDRGLARTLGIEEGAAGDFDHDGALVALAGGVRRAGRVTTVSPTFAREIARSAEGAGLEEVFAAAGDRLCGILNGLDVSVWNPATDSHLTARFDPMGLDGKARCKADLQRNFELPIRSDVPLLGLVADEAPAHGFDLFAKVGVQVLRNDCQVVVAWKGAEEAELLSVLRELSERWPDRMQVRVADARGTLHHRVISAADLVLVPSRREPCGFTQMQAHRYGALPVARRVGGLADSIIDCDAKLTTGTGFLFDTDAPEALLGAIRRGFAAFSLDEPFEVARRRVMTIDHSWERGARLYERLYRDAAST